MSNLNSRKVRSGKEKRICFCIAKEKYASFEEQNIKHFNLMGLIEIIAAALSKWAETFNKNPDKFAVFVERYDDIISDERHRYYEDSSLKKFRTAFTTYRF